MKIHQTVLNALTFTLLASVSAGAQQITGTPGSPSATVTIDGKQLPAPPPEFGGKTEFDAGSGRRSRC